MVMQGRAQGLMFSSNDSLITKRTSYSVFGTTTTAFRNHLTIDFDLSLWDDNHLGYIFNIADKNNSYSLSYVYKDNVGSLNFNFDRVSNRLEIAMRKDQLQKRHWLKVKVDMDLSGDKVTVDINGKQYHADKVGFTREIDGKMTFGKNDYYTEVPSMAVKNLHISNDGEDFNFPLDEWSGNLVHDADGNTTGTVENPLWLINDSYFWKQAFQRSFSEVAGLNFDAENQQLFIYKRDSLVVYHPDTRSQQVIPFKNPLPVPMLLGKSIFNQRDNKCYVYEAFDIRNNAPTVASLDLKTMTWQPIGKALLPEQRHHHNTFYNAAQDTIFLFGGYGSYKYWSDIYKYDATADKWIQTPFTGDKIFPRFFSAAGRSENPDEVLVFGGYGNESGNQIIGGKQLYDLYRINTKTHIIKKLWSITPHEGDVFVPANNLILSKDKKHFYALCYPHEQAKTSLRLYEFSITDGAYQAVSAPIHVTSEKIETDINLFYNAKNEEFYCAIQEFRDQHNSTVKFLTLSAPPVSSAVYAKSLVPPSKPMPWWWYGVSGLLVIVAATWRVSRQKKKKAVEAQPEPVVTETEPEAEAAPVVAKTPNTVHLLGEFTVYDKHNRDITYLFSPKIRQLFVLILLNSKGSGVSSKKISAVLWPDKDVAKTKNIKGVTFNHLRNIIADIDGLELAFVNDNYQFIFSEGFFCDYFYLNSQFKDAAAAEIVGNSFDLLARGPLLRDMADQWLDDFKQDYDAELMDKLLPEIERQYQEKEYKQALDLSKLVLQIDPFNDKAFKYELKSVRRLRGIEQSKKIYDQFVNDYSRSLGVDYPLSFEKILQ